MPPHAIGTLDTGRNRDRTVRRGSAAAGQCPDSGSCQDGGVENILGALLGVVLLLVGIACFPIGFSFGADNRLMIPFFAVGVLLISAALPVPIFLLDRLDGRG
jgi:hypothetical protein